MRHRGRLRGGGEGRGGLQSTAAAGDLDVTDTDPTRASRQRGGPPLTHVEKDRGRSKRKMLAVKSRATGFPFSSPHPDFPVSNRGPRGPLDCPMRAGCGIIQWKRPIFQCVLMFFQWIVHLSLASISNGLSWESAGRPNGPRRGLLRSSGTPRMRASRVLPRLPPTYMSLSHPPLTHCGSRWSSLRRASPPEPWGIEIAAHARASQAAPSSTSWLQ